MRIQSSWPMLMSAFGTVLLSKKPLVTALKSLTIPIRRHHGAILRPWSDFGHGRSTPSRPRPLSGLRILSTSTEEDEEPYVDEKENVYRQWALEDDQLLWKYFSNDERQSISQLAARLGRGLRGTEARIKALRNVNSAAYRRLFVKESSSAHDENRLHGSITADQIGAPPKKLIPACEVLRRIQWDPNLDPSDYTIRYYDRVDDALVDTKPLAPNNSISGKAEIMADAIPEHRIVAILYKERVVWDRDARMDLMFSEPGIVAIQNGYEQWKRDQEEAKRLKEEREAMVFEKTRQILGLEAFEKLEDLLGSMEQHIDSDVVSLKIKAERFVEGALALFRNVRKDSAVSLDQTLIPTSDEDALDAISEIVALQRKEQLRALLLSEIAMTMGGDSLSGTGGSQKLPEIDEDDIEETFVRGSG
jgi:uncharacterized protein (UPF0248 family)